MTQDVYSAIQKLDFSYPEGYDLDYKESSLDKIVLTKLKYETYADIERYCSIWGDSCYEDEGWTGFGVNFIYRCTYAPTSILSSPGPTQLYPGMALESISAIIKLINIAHVFRKLCPINWEDKTQKKYYISSFDEVQYYPQSLPNGPHFTYEPCGAPAYFGSEEMVRKAIVMLRDELWAKEMKSKKDNGEADYCDHIFREYLDF